MRSITVRDIPDQLYNQLKELAKRDHRSLSDEVIIAMEWMVEQEQLYNQRAAALQRIIERRKRLPATDVDSVELLREDRDR